MHGLWFYHVFQCYVRLHDKPLVSSKENAVTSTSKLSPKDLKNLHSKERRKEKKYQENKKGNSSTVHWRQCGQGVRAPDLKSGNPEFKSRSDHQPDLFQVVLGSTPWLHLYIANWSDSGQLGFLTC